MLRFDSLSKILSAGARLGWVSGPKALIDRVVLHGMVMFFLLYDSLAKLVYRHPTCTHLGLVKR